VNQETKETKRALEKHIYVYKQKKKMKRRFYRESRRNTKPGPTWILLPLIQPGAIPENRDVASSWLERVQFRCRSWNYNIRVY